MAVTKEQALDHIAKVYEYAMSLPGGPSQILARELAAWMQRHWAQAGANAAIDKRRAKNTASKQAATPAPAQGDGLQKFVHPKSPEAKAGEMLAPKSNAVEVPLPLEEAQVGQPRPQSQGRQKSQSHVAVDESATSPLSESEKEMAVVMKPRTILAQFGEVRILATLKSLDVQADDLPDSAAQMAAMMKQLIGSKK